MKGEESVPLAPVTNLPPAIQQLLPEIAADAGRARAQTLLAIQGADPDYVRPHIAAIDAALGASSPGIAGLAQLLRRAEEAVSQSQPTVRRQHIISQVVLRKFIEDVVPGGRQVVRFDLATGQPRLVGTGGVGYVEDFVPVDSKTTEDLWQEVEGALNDAIAASLGGTALASPTHRSTLRRVVALHFVRNPQTLAIHNQSFSEALQQGAIRSAETPLAAEAFRRRYGLEPAGPEALRLGAEATQGRLVNLHKDGGLFRLSVQRIFEHVSDRFESRGVEILTPANASSEFLVGDLPAITLNRGTGAAGLAEGVAVDQADQVIMPLSPRLLVAIGDRVGSRSISDDEVNEFNRLQVHLAKDYVVHRPGAGLAAGIQARRM